MRGILRTTLSASTRLASIILQIDPLTTSTFNSIYRFVTDVDGVGRGRERGPILPIQICICYRKPPALLDGASSQRAV
jgi:hypothetical protein